MYSKGDTIEFEDAIGIVLDNGMDGKKFVELYRNQKIYYLDKEGAYYKVPVVGSFEWEFSEERQLTPKHTVWYNIMIGDIKVWTEKKNLSIIQESQCIIEKET